MRVYIISWLGSEQRENRLEVHNKQLDWFLGEGCDVTVLSMGYQSSDYRDGVRYIDNEQVWAPTARNILHEDFYASNERWAIFADNDTIVHPYSKIDWAFFEGLDYIPHVHLFSGIRGVVQPFKKEVDYMRNNWPDHLLFTKSWRIFQLYFMTNFRRHPDFNTELYFGGDRYMTEKYAEDLSLPVELAMMGGGGYQCKNIALYSYPVKSTLKNDTNEQRAITNKLCSDYVVNNYPVYYSKAGKLRMDRVPFDHPAACMVDRQNNVTDVTNWHRRNFIAEAYNKPKSQKRTI